MMMKKLAFATLVALGMTTAAIAQQQPGQQPSQRQPSAEQPGQQQPGRSQTTPAPRGGDRTEQVSFETADEDSDGRISRDEAREIDGFDFSRADTNNDASLSRQEFQAAMAASTPRDGAAASARSGDAAGGQRSGQGQRSAQVTFDTADKNKDGRVTREEANDVPGLNFTAADTNDDAALSRQEFQTAMAGAQPRG